MIVRVFIFYGILGPTRLGNRVTDILFQGMAATGRNWLLHNKCANTCDIHLPNPGQLPRPHAFTYFVGQPCGHDARNRRSIELAKSHT